MYKLCIGVYCALLDIRAGLYTCLTHAVSNHPLLVKPISHTLLACTFSSSACYHRAMNNSLAGEVNYVV